MRGLPMESSMCLLGNVTVCVVSFCSLLLLSSAFVMCCDELCCVSLRAEQLYTLAYVL